jgi:hypothetical protein
MGILSHHPKDGKHVYYNKMNMKQSDAVSNKSDLTKRKLGARKGRKRHLKTTRRTLR